jgi:hypothetical protein
MLALVISQAFAAAPDAADYSLVSDTEYTAAVAFSSDLDGNLVYVGVPVDRRLAAWTRGHRVPRAAASYVINLAQCAAAKDAFESAVGHDIAPFLGELEDGGADTGELCAWRGYSLETVRSTTWALLADADRECQQVGQDPLNDPAFGQAWELRREFVFEVCNVTSAAHGAVDVSSP